MAGVGRARPAVVLAKAVARLLASLGAFAGAVGAMLGLLPVSTAQARVDPVNRLVVLARPSDADAITIEALSRVSGELAAAGFHIRSLPVSRDADARGTVETIGRELDPVAAFAIFPGPTASGSLPTAEIWVSDRILGRATVQRLLVDPQDANRRAAVLAVHAVELLKASLAELWVEASAQPPPAQPVHAVEVPASDWAARDYVLRGFALQAGAGVLAHANGFSAGWTPAVRLSRGWSTGWAARVTALGAGEVLEIAGAAGTARLRQQMVSLEGVKAFRGGARVQPLVSISAGAYRLGVSGTGVPPLFLDRTAETWAFVAGVGGGVVVRLGDHLALGADAQALAFLPRPAVRLGDVEVGQVGLPALLVTTALLGLF